MVDYSVAVCYGIIIDSEEAQKMRDLCEERAGAEYYEALDTLENQWCICIDRYEDDGAYFCGICYFLPLEESFTRQLDSYTLHDYDKDNFYTFMRKYRLFEAFPQTWTPTAHIVGFVS